MPKHYTDEKAVQVVISLLKEHGIKKAIVSPGATNVTLVASMQQDDFFKIYSCVDERSAAYMACGLAAESGEPVVISCTGATSSRNYLPGLTEAFYRKLPVLAITSTQNIARVGNHFAQVIDRSSIPNDVSTLSVTLPIVNAEEDLWECELKVNKAILGLTHRGGGPVHINLPTINSNNFDVKELPKYRVINRITLSDKFPQLPKGKIAIFVGSHKRWTDQETNVVDMFCEQNDAVVFCDHTSGYKGKFRIQFSLVGSQKMFDIAICRPDLLLHIGEVSGDYYSLKISGKEVWRINEDGQIRDPFRKIRYVFEMEELSFFKYYSNSPEKKESSYFEMCKNQLALFNKSLPDLPFSNIWIASKMARCMPENSIIHFGILNSLRSWNFFELPESVRSMSNVGGFGIDGTLSSLVGASLSNRENLFFGVLGDLAFFYDMNALGNRHIGNNIRILLINNGKGTEFRHHSHYAGQFGEKADDYIAAAGHFGEKSTLLVRNYVENLGFEYLTASNKEDFEKVYLHFLTSEMTTKPILFEVFIESSDESDSLELMINMAENVTGRAKHVLKQIIGDKTLNAVKKIIK